MQSRKLLPLIPLVLFLAISSACADHASTPIADPVFYAKNTKAYGETVTGQNPPEVVYGWDLNIEGDTAKWKECSSKEECTTVVRTRPKTELLGVEKQPPIEVNGQQAEVVKLSFTPRPSYVVPNFKPEKRTY